MGRVERKLERARGSFRYHSNVLCRFFTSGRQLPRSNFRRLSLRYGPPFLLAAIAAGFLSTPSSPCTFLRPIHNDAPKTLWFKKKDDHQRDSSISAEDAEKKINESNKTSGQQEPPPQTRIVTEAENGRAQVEEPGLWKSFLSKISNASNAFGSLGDSLADYIIPSWAKALPGLVTKVQNELSMAPGSLAEEIWHEANNPEINPEIMWEASVRVSNDLCAEEINFVEKRQLFTKRALARYLDIPEDKIHPDDVPIIAMCGSGGGLRALVAGTSSYLSTKEQGLFDCVTYTAGVSGSCWLQTLYYSSITKQSHGQLIRHLKNRLGVHIAFPPDALELIASAPTNKYLLSGLVEKAKGTPDAEFGIVDLYGLLLGTRLLVPKGELSVDERDFKVSNQRQYIDDGSHPLPIYTAVRHEIPIAEQSDMKDPVAAQAKAKKEAWFQWFE